ncbi:MAG: hypothetical protein GWO39_04855, partial [Gammaproteobacteria bacterium]|nr:hypothetical protein [Gammaproteobacteria bacterium]NIR97495.1 hypothetical protein [Gammaproteobacteria bacterium]NIT63133.1 hypothetical protein [Gammaproteobacteria bacterium]NIV20092.1 hypothetical protein [Gammaproteobacteria bacterium]NIY31713.1 hypothetical protein [Gammaproteobacteria bacterium]
KLIGRVIREDIEVVVRLSDQPQPMRADAGMMEQVIVNLCINARDAMPHGG